MDRQREQWEEAIAEVNVVGFRTWRKAKKAWDEEVKKAADKGRDPPRNAPRFTHAEEDYIWNVLEGQIGGVREIRRHGAMEVDDGEDSEEEAEAPRWTVQDIYHGLTPTSIARSWKHGFKTTEHIARYMAGRFVKAIEEVGRTEIWNKRCKVTVDWEKAHGINAMSKRARGRNCVEEHRRSSKDFMVPTLRPRRVPNVKEICRVADDRVKDSYLGRTKLELMERLGGMKFLMTMDCG
jgi:hypothetical protein